MPPRAAQAATRRPSAATLGRSLGGTFGSGRETVAPPYQGRDSLRLVGWSCDRGGQPEAPPARGSDRRRAAPTDQTRAHVDICVPAPFGERNSMMWPEARLQAPEEYSA